VSLPAVHQPRGFWAAAAAEPERIALIDPAGREWTAGEECGEQVKAVIEPAAGHRPTPALAEELQAHCAQRLARYKCPRSIDFTEAMPRDPNGKLYKRRLRDPYWQDRERGI
jgi:long-chain acyl-CoA synthetase